MYPKALDSCCTNHGRDSSHFSFPVNSFVVLALHYGYSVLMGTHKNCGFDPLVSYPKN